MKGALSTSWIGTLLVAWGLLLVGDWALGCKGRGSKVQESKDVLRAASPEKEVGTGRDASFGEVGAKEGDTGERESQEVGSRLHPASLGRKYDMEPIERLATSEEEREVLEMMKEARKGAKVLDAVKKGGERMRRLVVKALRCAERQVRAQAVLVLANLKSLTKEERRQLSEAIVMDPDPDVRAMAARAFVVVRGPEAIENLLLSLRQDPYGPARANAAWALGEQGKASPEVVDALINALQDKDTWVRLRVVSAIGRLRIKGAARALQRTASEDQNPMVRERASEVLKKLGSGR